MNSLFRPSMLERIFLTLGMMLFFLMLFVPTTYQPIKAALLAVILSAILIGGLWQRSNFRLHRSIVLWTLILVTTGAVFMLVGAVGAAPGALRVGTVYLVWPLVFTVLIGGLASKVSIEKMTAVLVWSGIAIGIYGGMYFGHVLGWLPDALYFELDQGQEVGIYEGYVEYNMYSISTLLFLVPFLFAALVHWKKWGTPIMARRWLWLAFLLCLALAFISGRRVLWLVLLISPVVYWVLSLFSVSLKNSRTGTTLRPLALLLFIAIAIFLFLQKELGLNLSAMAEQLFSAFDFSGEESASLRSEQAEALFSEWQERPLLGHGHGAAARGSLRSDEFPWAYELSYLALLFHTGLLGTLVYASCAAWVYWQGLKVARHSSTYGGLIIPILVGTTCFLIGNATNPYLEKFDFMWVVFLPLAIINRHLLESNSGGGRV